MAIDEVQLQEIRTLLHSEEVRKLILENMPVVDEVRITTGKAAKLLGTSEAKLREWDKAEVVKPERDPDNPLTSQRQYSLANLRKLVILLVLDRELRNSGKDLSDFAPYIDELVREMELTLDEGMHNEDASLEEKDDRRINRRIQEAREELFCRYFTSRSLRLALSLIGEHVPNTPVGLILPLQQHAEALPIDSIKQLPYLGPSLVGWLSKSRSSHTLLTQVPSFEYVTDFDLLPFTTMYNEVVDGKINGIYLILDRQDKRTSKLSLSEAVVTTINRLLAPLLENRQRLYAYFGWGMRDSIEPATDLETNQIDVILNGLADIVVQLGGYNTQQERYWRFCSILLPEKSLLPLHKRNLIICAQSSEAPKAYRIGGTVITSAEHSMSLSLHAFRSGNIQYRKVYSSKEPLVAYSDVEIKENVRSAIAVPIGGEDGFPLGVFYVASREVSPFSESDQRVLRLLGRMMEELLRTLQARILPAQRLLELIEEPAVVDRAFKRFFSETRFFQDVEHLLEQLQSVEESQRDEEPSVVSFIAIDVDQQGKIATKYGDRAVNNLNLMLAESITGLVEANLFKKPANCTLYHIHSDVFYLMLREITLEEAREKSLLLKDGINHSYQIDIVRPTSAQFAFSDSAVDIPNVTTRFGVTSYTAVKLRGMLQQYPDDTALTDVSSVIDGALRKALVDGRHQRGNHIFAWDETQERMVIWPTEIASTS